MVKDDGRRALYDGLTHGKCHSVPMKHTITRPTAKVRVRVRPWRFARDTMCQLIHLTTHELQHGMHHRVHHGGLHPRRHPTVYIMT